ADRELTAAIEADVAATLEAATADPQLGAAVRSGRLVKPLRYAGFGAMPEVGDAVATPVNKPARAKTRAAAKQPTPARKSTPTPKRAESRPSAELTEMRERVLELSGAADDAQRRYDEANRAVQRLRNELDEAERQ